MSKIKDLFSKKEKKSSKTKVVTQANLDESRDEVLAKGKKFRYPFQYAKHRIAINATIIGVIAVVVFSLVGWLQLYKFNNTGDVAYRFTRVIPLTVAKIDGIPVQFSDYLMLYRSSVTSIERQQGEFDDSEDAKGQLAYYQRQALSMAEEFAYAENMLAREGVSVSDEEIDEVIENHRKIDGERRSDESFAGIVRNNFGLNLNEYRRMIEMSLAKKSWSEHMDEKAKKLATEIEAQLASNGGDMQKILQAYAGNDLVSYESTNGLVGKDNLDGGRAEVAFAAKAPNEVSKAFVSTNGDGYYIVKMIERKDDQVSFESIWVRFSMFDEKINELRQNNKVEEKIELK